MYLFEDSKDTEDVFERLVGSDPDFWFGDGGIGDIFGLDSSEED